MKDFFRIPDHRAVASVMIVVGLLVRPAVAAAACIDGRPTVTYDARPDCSCFDRSTAGTRVYGLLANYLVTYDGRTRVLDGDARVACDATGVTILTHADGVLHRYPPEAVVAGVFRQNEALAWFPNAPPVASYRRRIAEGSAVLIRTY